MSTKILVPLDGSILAEGVLPYVKQMIGALGAQTTLLQVIEPTPEQIKLFSRGEGPLSIPEPVRNNAEQYLRRVASYLDGLGAAIQIKVVQGLPAVEIIGEGENDPTTIIAMSTHGRSGLARWLIGSVAGKVLQYSSNSVLLVRPKPHSPIAEPKLRTVVVPLDGSPAAEQILPHVVELAEALSLSVVLVRVTWSVADYYKWDGGIMGTAGPDYPQIAEQVDADATNYLEAVSSRLQTEGVEKVSECLAHGDPAGAIINLVQETQDSFVAMTTRGRTGLARMVLGSVADRVVRHCGEPVFLVRPQ